MKLREINRATFTARGEKRITIARKHAMRIHCSPQPTLSTCIPGSFIVLDQRSVWNPPKLLDYTTCGTIMKDKNLLMF